MMCIYWTCCNEFLKISTVSQNSAVHDMAFFQHAHAFVHETTGFGTVKPRC